MKFSPTNEVCRFLGEQKVLPAILALRRLSALAWKERSTVGGLNSVLESFLRLLERRGYFVSTPQKVAQTLEEIAGVGEGFDLHDLARALAEYETVLTECLALGKQRRIPGLQKFSSTCPCGRHPKQAS